MPSTPDNNTSDQDDEIEDLYADRPTPGNISEAVREAPLVAVATAFVAGLLVSRLLF
jgi:hypothetical protein